MALDLPPRRPMTHHNSSTRSPGSRSRPVSLAKIARSSSVRASPMAAMSKIRQASQLSPPNAAPKRCPLLRARRMVTKASSGPIDHVGRWRTFRLPMLCLRW
jgi:hypothetical protein